MLQAEDEWLPARIVARKEYPIPYTDRVQLCFDVKYSTNLDMKPCDIDIKNIADEAEVLRDISIIM